MYTHSFSSACLMLNEMCFLLMLRCRQSCLGSLCLAAFIYCQAEVDLQFSLYQILSQHLRSRRTREKPWRGAWEENQHIRVWLKPSKHSPSARSFFFCDSAFATDEQHMEKDTLYIRQHVLFVFLWTLRFVEPPLNEVRACSSCQKACSIETLPPLMRWRGKTSF